MYIWPLWLVLFLISGRDYTSLINLVQYVETGSAYRISRPFSHLCVQIMRKPVKFLPYKDSLSKPYNQQTENYFRNLVITYFIIISLLSIRMFLNSSCPKYFLRVIITYVHLNTYVYLNKRM